MHKQTIYQYLVEKTPTVQLVLNTQREIVYWNQSAYELYRYTKEEVLSKKVEDIIFFDEKDIERQFDFVRENSGSQENDVKVVLDITTRDKYQVDIPVKIDFTAIPVGEDQFVMLTIVDQTHQYRNEQKLIRKQEELEKYIESNLQLESFTFIASHNLKLPIQNIINFSGYLNRSLYNRLSRKERQYLKIIEDNSIRMKSIIQSLADYSSICNMPLNLTSTSTDLLLARVLKELEPKITAAQAMMILGHLPRTIFVDKYLTRLLFKNLIENSLLYKKDDVKLEIHISGTIEKQHYVFCVKDNGIGIATDFLTSIFGMFKRLHNDNEFEGNGTGLAFCKKIVELHNGEIWVESEEGLGSQFYVKIPVST